RLVAHQETGDLSHHTVSTSEARVADLVSRGLTGTTLIAQGCGRKLLRRVRPLGRKAVPGCVYSWTASRVRAATIRLSESQRPGAGRTMLITPQCGARSRASW